MVDYVLTFIEISKLPTTSSSSTVVVLKSIFAKYGIPEKTAMSDNGPQNVSTLLAK